MFLAAVLLFLTSQAVAAGKPAEPPPTPAPKATSNTFHSETLHLSYVLPKGLEPQAGMGEAALKDESGKATGVVKTAMQCVTVPLVGLEASNNFRMLTLIRLDETCLGAPIPDEGLGGLAKSTLAESLNRMGNGATMTAPVSYKLGEHNAAVIRGSVKSDKVDATFQALAVCTSVDKNIVCWEFVALKPEVADQLATATVHFDGHDPLAVVPTEVLAKVK